MEKVNLDGLAGLAEFAVNNNNTAGSSGTPLHELSIEDARARVVVKDGNRKANEDGSVALTLTLGKHRLSLEAVKKGATRVNATKEQVEGFTEVLETAVKGGDFDEAIKAAQEASANPVRKAKQAEVPVTEAPDGVDLDAIGGVDAEVADELEG